jgi:transposase-like protein
VRPKYHRVEYPKAVESLKANWERRLLFFDFPASIGSIRTTSVIGSAFATLRLREHFDLSSFVRLGRSV